MNTLTLSVKDRLFLRPILPDSGGIIKMTVVKSIKEMIEFTATEITEFQLIDIPGNGVQGNVTKFRDVEFTLSPEQVQVLKDMRTDLDKKEKVTLDILPLIDKIGDL